MTEASGPQGPITQALDRVARGETDARNQLIELVYHELRRMAKARVGHQKAAPIEATTLVHEAWLRLGGSNQAQWSGRTHFFAAAGMAMRNVLVDHARRRGRIKRGGGMRRHDLGTAMIDPDTATNPVDMLALDEALDRLESEYGRPSQVVVMRYFGGASMDDIAEALGVTRRTVERDWTFAKAWLKRALDAGS